MKRSVVIAVTALVAGLLLAISASAGSFRGYDRAADDQYTTTTPTTTTPTTTTDTTPTVGVTVTVGGQGTTPTTTVPGATTPTPTPTATQPTDDEDPPTDDDDSGTAPDDGSGAAPDEEAGAGAPTSGTQGSGSGDGSGRAAAFQRPRIALLAIGEPSPALAGSIVRVTGEFAWYGRADGLDVNALGDAAAGTPFSGLGEGDLDMDKLRGMAGLLGTEAASGDGAAESLESVLQDFTGTSAEAVDAVILTRDRLDDADDRSIAEAFQRSFGRKAAAGDIPVIGVELNDSDPSSIPYFKKIKGISSVDDVDTERGRESLVRLLAGAKPGHYGRQDTASAAQAPKVNPVSASAAVREAEGSLGGSPLLVGLLLTMALLAGRGLMTVARKQSFSGLRRR